MHRTRRGIGGFFVSEMRPCRQQESAWAWTIFFRSNGHRLRNIAAVVAPYLAAEAPALAAGVAAAGQAASSYSTLRDQLDRAAA